MLVLSAHTYSREPGCLHALVLVYNHLTRQASLADPRNATSVLVTFVTPQLAFGTQHHMVLG